MRTMKLVCTVLLSMAWIDGFAQGASAPSVASAVATQQTAANAASDTASNRQLAASVRSALRNAHRHGLKSSYIRVRANGGAVTLTGVVAETAQIALATSVAQSVPGVTSVDNKLKLRAVAGVKGTE
jgi:hyperosmotically inducible periplasmic protein